MLGLACVVRGGLPLGRPLLRAPLIAPLCWWPRGSEARSLALPGGRPRGLCPLGALESFVVIAALLLVGTVVGGINPFS